MHDQSGGQRPGRLENKEQLCGDHGIGDEIAISNPRKYLRPRQCDEDRITLDPLHGLPSARGGLDTRDDGSRAEQDETAKDDRRAIAPVDPSGEHQETDRRHRDHRDDGGHRSQQGTL